MTTERNANIYQRPSGIWWFRCQISGVETRCSLKTRDVEEAKRRREILIDRHHTESLDVARTDWSKRCYASLKDSQSWLRGIWSSANRRNRKKGFKSTIGLRSVYRIALKSRGRCAVTGIPFEWDGDKPSAGPYGISIDRVTAGEPYSVKNCRMVTKAVNLAMSVWGEDVFWDVASRAVGRKLMGVRAKTGTKKEPKKRSRKSLNLVAREGLEPSTSAL